MHQKSHDSGSNPDGRIFVPQKSNPRSSASLGRNSFPKGLLELRELVRRSSWSQFFLLKKWAGTNRYAIRASHLFFLVILSNARLGMSDVQNKSSGQTEKEVFWKRNYKLIAILFKQVFMYCETRTKCSSCGS